MKKVLKDAGENDDKTAILYDLGRAYFKLNKDTAILYFEATYQSAIQTENLIFLSKAAGGLSQSHKERDPIKSAEYAIISLNMAEKSGNPEQLAAAYRDMAIYYQYTGDLDKARAYHQKSLELNNQMRDSLNIARDYNGLGIIDMMQGKYDEGLEKWKKSLAIKLRRGYRADAANSMSNIALYYKDIGRYLEAKEYLDRSNSILHEYNDYSRLADNYQIMGELYLNMENYYYAIPYFDSAQTYFDSIKATYGRMDTYLAASRAYEGIGDYEIAMANLKDYVKLSDEKNKESRARISQELAAKYESEKKEHENLILKNENLLQETQIEEEERNIMFMSIGIGVIILVMIVIILMLRKVKQAKQDVEVQKSVVENKNQEITDSIEYAKRLQEAILPSEESINQGLSENFVLYIPKDIVAGDFYWMENLDDGNVLIAAADCTGHGVPGAMVSVVCHNALNRSVREFGLRDPGLILDKTTDLVIETFEKSGHEVKDGMDICLCMIDKTNNRLKYSGANNSLYHIANTEFREIKPTKQPVGKHEDRKKFETVDIPVKTGEVVYLFTDGYADQFGGPKGKKLKYSKFKELLVNNHLSKMKEQQKLLRQYFDQWRGELEQLDDVCVIGIRF